MCVYCRFASKRCLRHFYRAQREGKGDIDKIQNKNFFVYIIFNSHYYYASTPRPKWKCFTKTIWTPNLLLLTTKLKSVTSNQKTRITSTSASVSVLKLSLLYFSSFLCANAEKPLFGFDLGSAAASKLVKFIVSNKFEQHKYDFNIGQLNSQISTHIGKHTHI